MYNQYWSFRENPFQNAPNVRFAYLSEQHREGLARLIYLVKSRKLGGIISGPYGSGKSMILELLDAHLREQSGTMLVRLDAPPGGPLPMARQILRRMGFTGMVTDPSQALEALENICSETQFKNTHLALAIDEAQMIRSPETVEFLHLLTNLRTLLRNGAYGENALTLILAGHDEAVASITRDVSLRQRFQLVWKLSPLTLQQTMEYVHFRIRAAGGDIWIFEEEIFPRLYETSRGLPRLINNICDVALVLGNSIEAPKITLPLLEQAIDELDLSDEIREGDF